MGLSMTVRRALRWLVRFMESGNPDLHVRWNNTSRKDKDHSSSG